MTTIPVGVWQVLAVVFLGGVISFCVWIVQTLNEMKVKLATQEIQLIPLSAMIQAQLLNLLHHEDSKWKEDDELIDEFSRKPEKMSAERKLRLRQKMRQRMVADVPELEQKRAAAFLAFMDIVIIEKQTMKDTIANAVVGLFFGAALESFRYWHH